MAGGGGVKAKGLGQTATNTLAPSPYSSRRVYVYGLGFRV